MKTHHEVRVELTEMEIELAKNAEFFVKELSDCISKTGIMTEETEACNTVVRLIQNVLVQNFNKGGVL